MEWIEKMKSNRGKATACMTGENMVLLEEVASKHDCQNISELLVYLCNQSLVNHDEELVNLKEKVDELEADCHLLGRQLSDSRVEEGRAGLALEKCQKHCKDANSLLEKCAEEISILRETETKYKALSLWLQKQRIHISSFWTQKPPL